MLQITPHHRLLLAVNFTDFRAGIDSLAARCRQVLEEDPFSGAIFVFTNRPRTAVKILVYDGNGYWLCHKRFSKGRLAWWPSQQKTSSFSIKSSQLHILLSQGDPSDTPIPSDWRSVSPSSPSCRPP